MCCSSWASTSGSARSFRRPSSGRPASATSASWASTPPTSACASPWSWSRFRLSLVNNVDTMLRFLQDVDHPAVQANIDVSHLQLSGTAPEELRRLKGRATHVHLSDCDGKVHGDLPPGRGVVDFVPYLREIKDLGIDGAVSIELEYSPQPERIVEWVREAYEATDRLMRQVGLRG